jgi:hypothetical protein
MSRNCSVGMVTRRPRAARPTHRVSVSSGSKNFFIYLCFQDGSGSHSAHYPMDTAGSFSCVRRPGREAHHVSPSSTEYKDMWRYIPSYVFMVWCLIKHWDGFTDLTFAFNMVLPSVDATHPVVYDIQCKR